MYLQSRGYNELSEYFHQAKSIIRTGGLDQGYIVTYRDVYLKIYDADQVGSAYVISAYRYNTGGTEYPFLVRRVLMRDLREFASMFERCYRDCKDCTG